MSINARAIVLRERSYVGRPPNAREARAARRFSRLLTSRAASSNISSARAPNHDQSRTAGEREAGDTLPPALSYSRLDPLYR
jgi:hypothetical protein